jgi:hypothetical protein
MSAFTPKADTRPQAQNVCFGPKADIGQVYSITSLARASGRRAQSLEGCRHSEIQVRRRGSREHICGTSALVAQNHREEGGFFIFV